VSSVPDPPAGAMPAVSEPALAEQDLIQRLRDGDERAFVALLDRYHASLVRLARLYVHDHAEAEEVAQETWLGVLSGIDRFQGRSSLKTWIFHILVNRARTRAHRQGRTVSLEALEDAGTWAAVEPSRFHGPDHPRWPGHWASPPVSWGEAPEQRLLAKETLERVRDAIGLLPSMQAQVLTLRDVQGWSAEEVCELLEISPENQRVLLHRGRSKVRQALEVYLGAGDGGGA
jgi:RNA polymerase sigma-70 factor, ECF subfamily